jgi:hypothetical protein
MQARDERLLRRLQVAAREGRTWGVLWRRPGQQAAATAAPLRLALAPAQGKLAVRVLKRRGADLPRPIVVDLARTPDAPLCSLPDGSARIGRTSMSRTQSRSAGTRLPHRKAS